MEKNCCRIANANIHGGRIANPTERGLEAELWESADLLRQGSPSGSMRCKRHWRS